VNRIAQLLTEDFGLQPGNRVLLRGGNSIAMALAWLGVVQAGLVAVATMPLLRAKELGEIIEKARPALACAMPACWRNCRRRRRKAIRLPAIVPFNLWTRRARWPCCRRRRTASSRPARWRPTTSRLMAFTSGTTGKPKAAVHTHRDVLAACEAWPRHVLKARPDDIVIGSPPLAFTFGLGGMLIFPMWAGASVYYPSIGYTPEAMVKLINQVGATVCYTAPTFYRQMAAFAKQHGVPGLRLCVSAGESLPDATRQLWKDATGIEMIDGIGATEMFHIFISAAGADVRRGAIGKVVPGYTAKVVDDDGRRSAARHHRQAGRGGPHRLPLPGRRAPGQLCEGWLELPGRCLHAGRRRLLFLPGARRRHDHHRRLQRGRPGGGRRAAQAPGRGRMRRGGPAGRRPRHDREGLCRAQARRGRRRRLAKALQDHVKATLAPFKYPRQVEFVDKLPRTETGKLQRFKLRQP
jgi:2-aminobenzoate-CoA ligase